MAATSPALSPRQNGWLLATGVAVVAPLATEVEPWLIAVSGLTLAWRAWRVWRHMQPPPRWALFGLSIITCMGVFQQFHTLFGQNAGIALLILFIALKQLESRTTRDGLTIVFLALFLTLSRFIYDQTIFTAITATISVTIAITTLLTLADTQITPLHALRRTSTLLAQALPLMLVMFIFFPRIQGPLWSLPGDANRGMTGLSDSMSPGSISQLAQSDAIAFRARFPLIAPAQKQLYWRGLVLSEFDGRVWQPSKQVPLPQLPYREPDTGGIDYEVMIEPHGRRWLFALEMPGATTATMSATRAFELRARDPVTVRQRYALRAFPDLQAGADESEETLRHALVLPDGSNPRIRAIAAQWRQESASDDDVLRAAESFFRNQHLIYTLEPPLLSEQAGDEFLFDARQGFCEHFANAYAIAMRAAGIPARIVTGYQGGEINPVDGWLIVRQYDAHAWVEVWLRGRGWTRIDPTAISAPMRIDISLAAAVPAGDPLPLLARLDQAWLRDIRFRWEAVANAWNQWVLGYNPDRQRDLLRRLGMSKPDWQQMTLTLTALATLISLALTVWVLRQRQRVDPALALWNRISRHLARQGLARRAAEGPLDYAQRVGSALPAIAADIQAIAELYGRLRYGTGSQEHLDALRIRIQTTRSKIR
jgi:transglutaminase-like putative cysteine protease